jgi:transaldolase
MMTVSGNAASGSILQEKSIWGFSNDDFSTKVIAAGIRIPFHTSWSALPGCEIATIPPRAFPEKSVSDWRASY